MDVDNLLERESRDMFGVSEKAENVHSEQYVSTVVEPSFGIRRII